MESSLPMFNELQNILTLGSTNFSSRSVFDNPSYGPKDIKDICIISNKKYWGGGWKSKGGGQVYYDILIIYYYSINYFDYSYLQE